MVDTGAAGVVGDSVDEIRIARQIEHFDIAAARLDRGRDLEDAKRHEHPLVEPQLVALDPLRQSALHQSQDVVGAGAEDDAVYRDVGQ